MPVVRSEATGNLSANVCRTTFVLQRRSYSSRFQLTRVSLPRLPFWYARAAQVTVQAVVIDLPTVRGLAHLAEVLSGLKDGIGSIILSAFFASNEFEICVESAVDVTLGAELATALRLPETLVAGQCYASTVDEDEMNESSYYRVVVEGMDVRGFIEDEVYTQTIAEFRDPEQLSADTFDSTENSRVFQVNTVVVKKDGTTADLALGDTERAVYWVKIT